MTPFCKSYDAYRSICSEQGPLWPYHARAGYGPLGEKRLAGRFDPPRIRLSA